MGMKTAISIPTDIFTQAEDLARELGISRSELYTTAVARLLARHQAARVTTQLNEVYAHEPSHLDPAIARLQAAAIARGEEEEKW